MIKRKERGAALILALILVFLLSVLGISIMFVSQTEIWSSMDYRLMTQARYGAEAGLNRSLDYFVNTYVPPASSGSDLIGSYSLTPAQPVAGLPPAINQVAVSYGGSAVILSGSASVASNYPIAAVQTAFHNIANGTVTAGNVTVTYVAYATLVSMTPGGVQIWQITSDGTIGGVRNADVEVQAVLERQSGSPTYNYGAFSSSNGCGSMTFSGGTVVNSYNSSAITCTKGVAPVCSGGSVIFSTTGGNVGTNGNLGASGSATIDGNLSTPRSGVGSCSAGNVTSVTTSGGATVTGGEVHLPQAVNYPLPTMPTPAPPTGTLDPTQGCKSGSTGGCHAGITPNSSSKSLNAAPGSYPDLKLSGGTTLYLTAGTYNLNSIAMSGGATLVISSGPVTLNVTGAGQTTPIDFSGGSVSNATLDPSQMIINYAGSGNVSLSGGAGSAALLYAPNASLSFSGGGDFYGAVISALLTDTGGAAIHYDRALQNKFLTTGNWMLDSFTWKKF